MTASCATSRKSSISRLHAIETGTGPLALCLHGITANAYVFEPLMTALAARFRVMSLDQRGHGRSPKPARGYASLDYANDLQDVLTEKALLIGHSLGARNALVAGLRFPGRVAAVVAIDFTPYIEPEVFDALEERVAGGDQNFASMKGIQTYLAGRYPQLPAHAVARRAQYGYKNVDGKWRPLAVPQAMRETCMGLREDLTGVLTNIRVPVLLMRGADSRLVSREAWAKTRALRPDLPAVEIAGADHYVPEERPHEVAAAVREFWDSIARGKA
jgi:2-(acetamidomethylene)succinate hydrolase